jgi:hypothetical protein
VGVVGRLLIVSAVLPALQIPTTAFAQAGAGMAGWIGSAGPAPREVRQADVRPEGGDPAALDVEQRLHAAGFSPGPVDGVLDRTARDAIRRFQRSRGMDPTGELDTATRAALSGPIGRRWWKLRRASRADPPIPRPGRRERLAYRDGATGELPKS